MPGGSGIRPSKKLPGGGWSGLELTDTLRLIIKCAITAQSAQLHLGTNKTLAQLKICIVMSSHNMEKVVVLNMLIANFPKYFNNCTDCAFHKFALIALLRCLR